MPGGIGSYQILHGQFVRKESRHRSGIVAISRIPVLWPIGSGETVADQLEGETGIVAHLYRRPSLRNQAPSHLEIAINAHMVRGIEHEPRSLIHGRVERLHRHPGEDPRSPIGWVGGCIHRAVGQGRQPSNQIPPRHEDPQANDLTGLIMSCHHRQRISEGILEVLPTPRRRVTPSCRVAGHRSLQKI
jgi:hypothetical protein